MTPVLLILYCLGTGAEHVRQLQKSTWEVHQVRRTVDTEITMATLETRTVASCSYSCSELMGVQAVSLYFVNETNKCYCNKDIDSGPEDDRADDIVYGTLISFYKKEEPDMQVKFTYWPYQPDCLSLHAMNYRQNALYTIHPIGGAVTDTWCDMANGGWTVIQRRLDGSENFNRGWTDYVNGFGNRTGEYWLGLENIHHLTKTGSHLEIWMEAFPGVTPPTMTARYTSFMVSDNATEYTLHVSGFTGDCRDSFKFLNGQRFSTFDNDNDRRSTESCAKRYGGGFWFNNCHKTSPNGHYYQTDEYSYTKTYAKGIHWVTCWYKKHSAKSAVMKIRSL